MSNEDIEKAIEAIFNKDFISLHQGEQPNRIKFEETKKGGEGICRFQSNHDIVRIKAKDQAPIIWALKNKKCAEGAFVLLHGDDISLHILEMKSGLNRSEFQKVIEQFKGMYLSALAIIGLLNLPQPKKVMLYIVYKRDKISQPDSRSLIANKPLIGKAPIESLWRKGKITLHGETANLIKGQRDAQGDYDFGLIS